MLNNIISHDNIMFKTYTDIDKYINNNIPYGRIIEISGANNSYKTSCMLSMINTILTNNQDSVILYFDCDLHLRIEYLKDYNLFNTGRIVFNYNTEPECILDVIRQIHDYNISDIIIVLDTISNIKFNNVFKDLKSFLSSLAKVIYNSNIIVFAINQNRYSLEKNKKISFCSKCFDIYSSLRLNIVGKTNDKLLLNIQKNKFTGLVNVPVEINIGKINDRQY